MSKIVKLDKYQHNHSKAKIQQLNGQLYKISILAEQKYLLHFEELPQELVILYLNC